MAINFVIGDVLIVKQQYVKNTLARRTRTPSLVTTVLTLQHFSGVPSTVVDAGQTIVFEKNIPQVRSFIKLVPTDPRNINHNNGQGVQIFFENDTLLNNSFEYSTAYLCDICSRRALNNSGVNIPKYAIVRYTGFDPTTQLPTIALANATTQATAKVMGIAEEDVDDGEIGSIIVEGAISGVDTTAFNINDTAYLSDTPGEFGTAPGTVNSVVGRVHTVGNPGSLSIKGELPFESAGGGGTGTTGLQGNTGIKGCTGIQGHTGLALGSTGLQGTQGDTGLVGAAGAQGTTGLSLQGVTGLQGTQGSQGDTGLAGQQGIQGITGLSLGQTGLQGIQGETGTEGVQGLQGVTGLALGSTGLQGIQGDTGVEGAAGPQGVTGLALGVTGLQGVTGFLGVDGQTGIKGCTGPQGFTGLALGTTGLQGIQGSTGVGGSGGSSASINTIRFTVGTAATTDSSTSLPVGARVIFARFEVTTAYDVANGINVGRAGATDAYITSAEINADATGSMNKFIDVDGGSAAVRVTITTSPGSGAGVCTIWYTTSDS